MRFIYWIEKIHKKKNEFQRFYLLFHPVRFGLMNCVRLLAHAHRSLWHLAFAVWLTQYTHIAFKILHVEQLKCDANYRGVWILQQFRLLIDYAWVTALCGGTTICLPEWNESALANSQERWLTVYGMTWCGMVWYGMACVCKIWTQKGFQHESDLYLIVIFQKLKKKPIDEETSLPCHIDIWMKHLHTDECA